MTPNEKLLREALEQIINSVPTFSDGSFFIAHYDFNGEPQGSEQVDPADIVQHLEGIAHRALAATEQPVRQDAAYAELRAMAEAIRHSGDWLSVDRTVYALEHHGWRNGEELMRNRFSFNVQRGPTFDDKACAQLATYIAAANPAAILALLADNDRMAERLAHHDEVAIKQGLAERDALAEQVARAWKDRLYAAMDAEFVLYNSAVRDIDDQRLGMRNDDTQIGVEFAMRWFNRMLSETNSNAIAHTAPEPVSVPAPWHERLGGYPAAQMPNSKREVAMTAEIAEWRALAAERGWVK